MFIYDKEKELEKIEACIANGEYKDDWDSLAHHKHHSGSWTRNSGFLSTGGIYSISAFGGE